MSFSLKTLQSYFGERAAKQRPQAFFIQRQGGLGDVIMALAAIHAVRLHHPQAKICFHTESRYLPLAERCPHIDEVFTDEANFKVALQAHIHGEFETELFELGSASFGINRDHEVNAFLVAMGLHAPSMHKTPVVDLKPEEERAARKRIETLLQGFPRPWILLHPAKGDRNRTWSEAHWNALIDLALAEGCTPVVVGDNGAVPQKGILKIVPRKGLADLTNRLGLLELLQLCRMADVLVSPDSGPVQLAALSDIGIVGIYSTVAPRCRLPFRHGMLGWRAEGMVSSCPNQGCYKLILKDDHHFDQFHAAVKRDLEAPGRQALNTFMGDFCAQPGKTYICLEEISPEQVWAACARLLEAPRHLGQASHLESACGHLLAGRGEEALEAVSLAAQVSVGPEILEARALALLLLGRIDEAIDQLKQAIATWPGAEVLNLLGIVFHLQGAMEKADRHLELATTWNEAYEPTLMNRALIRASRVADEGKMEEAMLLLDCFYRMGEALPAPLALHVLPTAQAHLLKGWLILQHCTPERTRVCFEQALESFPDSREAFLGMAECFHLSGRVDDAVALLQDVLQRDPDWELGRKMLEELRRPVERLS